MNKSAPAISDRETTRSNKVHVHLPYLVSACVSDRNDMETTRLTKVHGFGYFPVPYPQPPKQGRLKISL